METIRIDALCKSYGNTQAVNNLSISVERGEVFGLLGANGAGKSTTIECVLGTKKFSNGSISILGMNPQTERKELFERVGVQFQESNYQDKITVAELCEVTQALYKHPSDYVALLKQFGLSDKFKSQVNELSGGQQQRVSIGRALAYSPSIVLADEPTGNLDSKNSKEIIDLLKISVRKYNQTLILITHDLNIASQADRIITIGDGNIIKDEVINSEIL